jgi:lipopolysaccharide export LptBFGC system permease protein LptF
MNNTQFTILLVVIIIAIIATAFTVNSCNEKPEDTSKLQELIIRHLNKSDSLQKVALDSMLAISQRDSAHTITIQNIFNNSNKNKNEIIKNKPDNKRIVSILSWADSIARANQQPNTGW